MASYPAQLVFPHYNFQVYNGESSRGLNLTTALDHNTNSPLFETEVTQPDDQAHFNTINPLYVIATDYLPLSHNWLAGTNKMSSLEANALPASHSEADHFEATRRANGLQLKARADMVPHVRYPFTGTKFNGPRKPLVASSSPDPAPAPASAPALGRVSKRPRPRTLADGPGGSEGQLVTAKVSAPGDRKPLIKFYSRPVLNRRPPRFYRRVFLAGPPGKKVVGDRRIFYRREFL